MSARDELAALLADSEPRRRLYSNAEWLWEHGPAMLALIEAAQNTLGYLSWAADDSPIPELRDALAAALARLTGGHDE